MLPKARKQKPPDICHGVARKRGGLLFFGESNMTDREHVSITWLEGKVSDQLDELYGIVDAVDDRMDRLEQRQEELVSAFNSHTRTLNSIADVLGEMKDKYNAMVERHNAMVDQVQKAAAPQPAPDATKPTAKKPAKPARFKPKIVPKNGPDKRPPAAS
jgi:peptidoglycan hydrolase CwlO-like protein